MAIQHPFRRTYLSRHHLTSKERGGTLHPSNVLRLWRDVHDAWHFIFLNWTLEEIITRLHQKKKWQQNPYWFRLFREKTPEQVIRILKRIQRMKRRLRKTSKQLMLPLSKKAEQGELPFSSSKGTP